jgi:hypothetical protein
MRYEIRVAGKTSKAVSGAFPELRSFFVPGQTVLYGHVTDEAHLYGLLTRFLHLGLHVVEVRRLPG